MRTVENAQDARNTSHEVDTILAQDIVADTSHIVEYVQ